MATLKLTMDSRAKKNATRNPIIIRLSHNGKSTSISTKVKLAPQEWDQKKGKVTKVHPDYITLNLHFKKKLLEYEKKVLGLPMNADELSIVELRQILLNKKKPAEITFWEFAQEEIESQKQQHRYGNANSYHEALNRLIKHTGKELRLNKVNYTLISAFDALLLKEGLSKNTVAFYMREIRALLNKAIKKDLLDRTLYPFNKYIIKGEKTVSRAITMEDLEKLRVEPLEEGSKSWNARNIFFLTYNLIGINFIDLSLLTTDNIQNGRIVYRRRKTHKIYSVRLTPEAERIFNTYKNDNSKYLLPIFNLDGVTKEGELDAIYLNLKVCNKYLKKLGTKLELPVKLTTYVARYSWANVAKTLGFSKDLIAESLGHEYGNSVTGIYLDSYGSEIIDGANEKVTTFKNELQVSMATAKLMESNI